MLMIISAIAGGVAATVAAGALSRRTSPTLVALAGIILAAAASWLLPVGGAAPGTITPLSAILAHLAVGAVAGGAAGVLSDAILRALDRRR